MRAFLIMSILALAAIVVTGYALGWFTVTSTSSDHKTTWSVTVDKDKWHTDRDEYRKQAEAHIKAMDKKIDDLQARATHVETEARDGLVRTIADLRQRQQAIRDELAQSTPTTKERWEAVKTRVAQALDDLEHGFQKAWSRFKDK